MKSLVLGLAFLLAGSAFAQGGPPGPPGPQGPPGDDASIPSLQAGLGTDLRLWDSKHTVGSLDYRHDFIRPGNALFGMVGIKLGKSYQDEKIQALEAQLDALTRIIERVTRQGSVEVSPSEPPIKATIRGKK